MSGTGGGYAHHVRRTDYARQTTRRSPMDYEAPAIEERQTVAEPVIGLKSIGKD
jgi:hypothetical protein